MAQRVAKTTLVLGAAGVYPDAVAGNFRLNPVALVGVAVGKDYFAKSVRFALCKRAGVNRAVLEFGSALTAGIAFNPFATIFVSIGQAVGAGAVPLAIQKGTLKDTAIIILFGDHFGCVLAVSCTG